MNEDSYLDQYWESRYDFGYEYTADFDYDALEDVWADIDIEDDEDYWRD